MDIKGAKELACTHHAGQTDELGRAYTEHHLREVAQKLTRRGKAAVMAGWLHDILEDTHVTPKALADAGVPDDVIRAVLSVSKRDGEWYDDLITRAAADPVGRWVKLADNAVNLESNDKLAARDPKLAERLRVKYERARKQLHHHPSHLFVVQGKIGELVHDAVIVPTDADVTVEKPWTTFGEGQDLPHPAQFSDGWARWGRSSAWLVDVASGDFDDVLERLRRALESMKVVWPWDASTQQAHRGLRALPLVVIPVLGIGRGGRGDDKGGVLTQLIEALQEEVGQLPFDIALVTPDPAVYAAAQYMRRRNPGALPVDKVAESLADKARAGQLALFLGAGVSIPAGLPSWQALVDELASRLSSSKDRDALEGLDVTDKAQLIEQFEPKDFQRRVARITARAKTPSLAHALLAGLDVKQVVTTNYDTLFEKASAAAGHGLDVVLPRKSAIGRRRWILKMHGDVRHPTQIVLTRRHMVMYDAANRPSAALLQSLLLTKHLVIIGASMTDPNVVRLAHEVDAYRKEHGQRPRGAYGTVLDAGSSSASQGRLWKGQLDWVDLPGMGIGSGPRTLEILLDRVGMFASSESSWLLDPRFSGLLRDDDQKLAQRVRELAVDVSRSNYTWRPLRDALMSLGVDGETFDA